MSREDLKALAIGLAMIAAVIGTVTLDLSCKRASLERVAGRPVSLWDTFVLMSSRK